MAFILRFFWNETRRNNWDDERLLALEKQSHRETDIANKFGLVIVRPLLGLVERCRGVEGVRKL